MSQKIILTGVTPSGTPHLGNYIGAIKPAIEMIKNDQYKCMYFIADQHSLIKLWDKKLRQQYIYEIAASWLALGLDPDKAYFYRQSDIPEIMELTWIISTTTAKGLLNRAHAYKALVDQNLQEENADPDKGITMGLFNYPVLMAADILMFDADLVPVGKDQIQHIEIARDIANRFNHIYQKSVLKAPQAMTSEDSQTILGLDGRKMSKSYDNTIAIFSTEKKLRKQVMKIITNSQTPEEKKDPNSCTIFAIYKSIASQTEIAALEEKYLAGGLGWGDAKQILFEKINEYLRDAREKYDYYINNPKIIDDILNQGAAKVRPFAKDKLKEVKDIIGM
ncbi:tryptophan--tRNA ligase [Francisella tularensis subsp. novicida]|uniref:tryptophan--tRNA ligase n=1 Tax=Francisella tularensis TaxID=263 RepID=UPI0008FD2985|nr:tryptophan--tRNA ligase [Francisella tularensis]APC94810.1 tryptophan--tRNA ligase [Francisella tularensis subsp. novicida]MBK2346045.1 tryptophan--tRNA ligase [Francisella tularensis subsp. novicida]